MIRLVIRIILLLIVLLLLVIPFYITSALRLRSANRNLTRMGFRIGCILLGIHVKTNGTISDQAPLLVVSNHFTYLDVFVLGSALKLRFTPKIEIASWPLIGFFCKINGCIFIDRRPSLTGHNKGKLEAAMKMHEIIGLFPEGTTNEGTAMLPFKSSFFSIAENRDLPVQPVSIIYTHLNGAPVTLQNRHIIGWYGDMEFIPHAIVLLKQRSVHATLVFHSPVNGKDFSSRKELANYCQNRISSSLPPY